MKVGALLVAGAFALAGCAGGSEGGAEAAPAESSTPTPTLAVGAEQYTADELEAALEAVKADKGLSGDVENDAMLRPQLSGALPDVKTTPDQCQKLITSALDEGIGDGNLAAMTAGEGLLTAVSYKDSSRTEQQADTNEQMLADCAEFTMETAGMVVTGEVEGIDAQTDAPTTQGVRTTVTRDGGTAEAIQISALSGTLQLSITQFDPAGMDAAVADAEELINAVLAELEK